MKGKPSAYMGLFPAVVDDEVAVEAHLRRELVESVSTLATGQTRAQFVQLGNQRIDSDPCTLEGLF